MDLPLNGRDAFALAGLAPGVNPTGGGSTPHISGSQTSTSEVQIDGATAVTANVIGGLNRLVYEPQVDAVQEFSVQVNGLAAEYGRFAGGVLNVVTKSGTNAFHGTAYDFLRNSELDANNFFANRAGLHRGSFKRNQWGGTLGGPVHVPGLYNGRDKTFFFLGYEATNVRPQSVFTGTVPQAKQEGGYRRSGRRARSIDLLAAIRISSGLEMFNAFNTAQFAGPGTTIGAGNFGVISGVASPARQIQMALKLLW